MKNLSVILYLTLIGFLSTLFSSAVPLPIEVKPDVEINSERVLLMNRNRIEKSYFDIKSCELKKDLDSINLKYR